MQFYKQLFYFTFNTSCPPACGMIPPAGHSQDFVPGLDELLYRVTYITFLQDPAQNIGCAQLFCHLKPG